VRRTFFLVTSAVVLPRARRNLQSTVSRAIGTRPPICRSKASRDKTRIHSAEDCLGITLPQTLCNRDAPRPVLTAFFQPPRRGSQQGGVSHPSRAGGLVQKFLCNGTSFVEGRRARRSCAHVCAPRRQQQAAETQKPVTRHSSPIVRTIQRDVSPGLARRVPFGFTGSDHSWPGTSAPPGAKPTLMLATEGISPVRRIQSPRLPNACAPKSAHDPQRTPGFVQTTTTWSALVPMQAESPFLTTSGVRSMSTGTA